MGNLKNVLQKLLKKSNDKKQQPVQTQIITPLKLSLQQSLEEIKRTFGPSPDIIIREIQLGEAASIESAIIYTDGLADVTHLLESVMIEIRQAKLEANDILTDQMIQLLQKKSLSIGEISVVTELQQLYTSVLSGDTAMLFQGSEQGLLLNTRKWNERNVEEPNAQSVVRGPRDGFTENIRTNTALVRRRIKDPNLWMETIQVGRISKTEVALMYMNGIVTDKVLEEVRRRVGRIDIDAIFESGNIEELIQDETFTFFPTVYNTERPDSISSQVLEGRVAIFVDGTPFVLTVPALFTQFFQASEDYYQRADFATLLRMLRFLCFFISLLAPSLYIAVTTFHQELLPPQLLIGLIAAREGVPFPAFIEALLMEVTFEILREAGLRLPKSIGQAVSIVGTLVIGQAAVEAGLVSPSMVIVVSLTAISNFVFPSFSMGIAVRMLRFPVMLLAASFGLFGITVGLIAIVLHLCSLRSFGIPYLSPFGPFNLADQKDSIFRLPQWALYSRPRLISQKNVVRENNPPTPKPK
ncbi:spore germination protein KA [Paenibacillus sp. yr247]|uniref:spore germination protein n=1 Tax=Paenibacillus sp. yr247 TaxID=1761880 RepID=UPI00088F2E59|nr:spore germination protein [Paenibacillus sp. yr247]SDN03667.1 spore germination protein KA [Paenibacillus sp. yr247]